MSTSDDPRRLIQTLISRALEDQLGITRQHNEMRQRIARGLLDEREVNEEYLAYAREVTDRYNREVAALSLEYYNRLLKLGQQYSQDFYDRLLSARDNGSGAAPAAEDGKRQQVVVELQGPVGGTVQAAFNLQNRRGEPAAISFAVSPFTGPDGPLPYEPPLRIEPSQFTLGPYESREVTIRLPLVRTLFTPSAIYRATAEVVGFDKVELVLVVAVTPAEEATEAPPVEVMTKPQLTETGEATAAVAAPQPTASKRATPPKRTVTRKTIPKPSTAPPKRTRHPPAGSGSSDL